LVAEDHLAAWTGRNQERQPELRERLAEAGLPSDRAATLQIAKRAYQQTEKSNGQVWVIEKVLRHLDPGWVNCFVAWLDCRLKWAS
jgi:hypothetical protein